MSALATALDNMTPTKFGENNHIEYTWSNQIREKITQIYFQLVRTENTDAIAKQYRDVLLAVFTSPGFSEGNLEVHENAELLYKMIAQTRDIVSGKGEYALAYVLIGELAMLASDYNPGYVAIDTLVKNMVKHVLRSLINLENQDHPLGSWKDIKYFLNYWCKRHGWDTSADISTIQQDWVVDFIVNLSVSYLRQERERYDNGEKQMTLVARWLPSESSNKFGWQTKLFAMAYYSEWMESALNWHLKRDSNDFSIYQGNGKKALRKCLTNFRKIKGELNRALDTPQIDQCAKTWSNIDFDKNVTSITLSKQKEAFQNKKGKMGEVREATKYDEDRIQCAKNYAEYLERCQNGTSTAKGARVSMFDFVKNAFHQTTTADINMTNMQWDNNASNTTALSELLAIIDVSASMMDPENKPYYNAIGLGIRIAEKSSLGRRALTFSSDPEWIVFNEHDTFTDMVWKTKNSNVGGSTNIGLALRMILQVAIRNNLSADDMVKGLVILSDMQIDKNTWGSPISHNFDDVLVKQIEREFRDARCFAAPNGYDMPKVIFWNLAHTDGFPSGCNKQNVYMMSGFSPALLNQFSEEGISALENCTPFNGVIQALAHERYNSFTRIFRENIEAYHMEKDCRSMTYTY